MAQPFIRNMLSRQRRRALAIILNYSERAFYERLTIDEQAHFRSVVLSAVSSYHDACLDMLESSVNDGMLLNEEAVRVVAQFNENLQRHRDELAFGVPLDV
jgi:hypothetical protein